VVEELRKLNKDLDSFLESTNIPLNPKGNTPLSVEIMDLIAQVMKEVMMENKEREKENSLKAHHQPSQI
jgi:hypothetical protein